MTARRRARTSASRPGRRRAFAGTRAAGTVRARVASLDWPAIAGALDARGYAATPPLIDPAECDSLIATYTDASRFRSRVDMAPRRFGEGEYKYFDRPLPPVVRELRRHLYPPLAAIANAWNARLSVDERFPRALGPFLDRCAAHAQRRPTPLLLRYEAGGYNCLHQDRYGALWFPLQVAIALSRPADYEGGEFLLVEQRPRAQSRGVAVSLERGQAVIFPNSIRPARGARGFHRVQVRHGVSTVRRGVRYALGIIFHDAK